jgi:hypothetical protein
VRRSFLRSTAALTGALALALGCADEQQAPTAAADPSAARDPVSQSTPAPSFGATVLKIPNDYFLILDADPDRDYTATFGLVSPVSELEACGGSGPEVFDGGGTRRIVATPSGAVHVRDELHQATIVFYAGATEDVCELATHPVLARGRGNLHFTVKNGVNGSTSFQATFGGILDLAAGGRARMLGVGNIVFDAFGNLTIHEDHFDLKPIGH